MVKIAIFIEDKNRFEHTEQLCSNLTATSVLLALVRFLEKPV